MSAAGEHRRPAPDPHPTAPGRSLDSPVAASPSGMPTSRLPLWYADEPPPPPVLRFSRWHLDPLLSPPFPPRYALPLRYSDSHGGIWTPFFPLPPPRYADAYDGLAYVSSQWGCSLSIAVLSSLLGSPGWLEAHVAALQRTMRSRCLALLCALDKHMRGLARWSPPAAGMFLWLRLAVPAPSRETLVEAMDAHGVVAVPGADCSVAGLTQHDPALFHPSGDGAPNPQPGGAAGNGCPQPCAYLRLSYVIDEAEYDGAARRLRALALSLRGGEHSTDSNSRTDLTADDAGTSNVCG